MAPADKGLGSDDLGGIEFHDRLVLEDELVPLDGPAEFGLHGQSSHDRVVHLGLEDLETGLALGLRGVHRNVGVTQQFGSRVARLAACDADAGADVDLLAEKPERNPQRGPDALGDAGGSRDVGVFEQDGELVAAKPRGRVLGADRRPQPMRGLDQDVVAGGVTEAVVDRLEVVEVDEEDRQVADLAAVEGVFDPFPEQAPVGQSRQRIVEGLEGELLLERLAFLQVPGVQDHARFVAVEGAARRDRFDRQPASVALTQPPFAAHPLARRLHGSIEEALDGADILGMGEVSQATAKELTPRRTKKPLDRGADVVDRPDAVDGHDQIGRIHHEPAEAGLGLAPRQVQVDDLATDGELA